MSGNAGRPVLLDTTVLVHIARNSGTGRAIEAEHQLSRRLDKPLISTISEGEILGLARCWGWGERRLKELRGLLGQLVSVDAGLPEIIDAYAILYAQATREGKPRGENDLWIAATARVLKAELLTCDQDFLWLQPEHITVHYTQESQ